MQWEAIIPVLLAGIAVIAALVKLHGDSIRAMREGFKLVARSNDRHNRDARKRAKKARKAFKRMHVENRESNARLATEVAVALNGKHEGPVAAKGKRSAAGPADG